MKTVLSFLASVLIVSTHVSILTAQWVQVGNFGLVRTNSIIEGGGNLYGGTAGNGGIFKSSDNGSTWKLVGLPNYWIESMVATDSFVFAGTNSNGGGIYRSEFGNDTWISLGLTSHYFGSFLVHGTAIFAGTIFSAGGFYLSTNNGRNWSRVDADTIYNINALAIKDPNLLFAGTDDGVFLSTNNGINWISVNVGLPSNTVLSLAVKDSFLFAGTYADGVFRSSNNGASWTTASVGLTIPMVTELVVSDKYLFASTDPDPGGSTPGDVFYSSDNGSSWSNTNLWISHIMALNVCGQYLFAGGTGGIYRNSISQITSVNTFDQYQIPSHPVLEQNYPNPFNPQTTISFLLPKKSYVSLVVYDIMGKAIATLISGELSAGRHIHQWDARDVASGIYFYRLQDASNIESKKLILLR